MNYNENRTKKLAVLTVAQGDRLDSPASVIRSLFQADPFPCSVASLGHTDLFKALEPPDLRQRTYGHSKLDTGTR